MLGIFLNSLFIIAVGFWPFHADGSDPQKVKKSSYELPANSQDYAFIKILVQDKIDEVTVSTEHAYRVLDDQNRPVFSGSKMNPLVVKAAPNGIQIGNQIVGTNPLTILSEGHGIRVNGAKYGNCIQIFQEAAGKISVVNFISIEDYLKGVLPAEVNPKWPIESLKAQAIASRTYALFKIIENQDQRHHVSKGVLSQVYAGRNSEKYNTSLAVDATRGQVLVYQNKIFPAYFHSTCGGRTTQAEYQWSIEPHPALQGVECNFCWKSPHYRWHTEITAAEIESKLRKQGMKISEITDIKTGDKDSTGRAKYFIVTAKTGVLNVQANDFRVWVAPMQLKSTWIQLIEKKKGGRFIFKGRGWGHGAGLCQYGEKQLGEMGYPAASILQYYYPGTQIVQYWSSSINPATTFKNLFAQVKEKLEL